jgi:hypothetical protein
MRLKFLSLYLNIGLLGLLALMLFGAFYPSRTNASDPTSILVNVVPENPAPGDNTTITLNSYANNLDSVLISWSVNGKVVSSGTGKKSFSVTAPGAGSEVVVIASVSLPDGTVDTRIIIRPAVMVLLWQAEDSYVPPFYKGKAFPAPDSKVKVVAMPEVKNGSQIVNPANMVYAWKQDYNNNQDGSGYGKNSFSYTNDYLDNSNNIDVVASTTDQKYSSEANINIVTYQPKIEFYKNDPNMGTLWEQALSDGHTISGDEIMEAAPYFISPKDIRIPSLVWNWFINDNMVNTFGFRKNLMSLKVQPGISGTSKIRLEISNNNKIFETASKEINVNF